MYRILIPAIAAVALVGTAAGAMVLSNSSAAPPQGPRMIAPGGEMLAQAAAPNAPGRGPGMRPPMRPPADMTARRTAMCADRYARAAGRMAYLQTRLTLTPAQVSLFDRWKSAMLDQAKARQTACAAPPAAAHSGAPSPVDRMTRESDMLRQRLAALDAERPALAALFGALTPQQQQMFTRQAGMRQAGMRRAGGPRMAMRARRGMMGGRGLRGQPGRGFPRRPGGPPQPPPPPPPT